MLPQPPLPAESMPWPRLLLVTFLALITKVTGASSAKSQKEKRIQFWNLSFHSEAERKELQALEEKENYDQKEDYYQKEDYRQKEGNQLYTLEDPIQKDGNYQFQFTVGYKTHRASYYSGPKNLYLNYLKKFQNLTFNLKSAFLKHPYLLTSCQVKKKAEDYLKHTTETYLRYKTEEKMKEVKEKKKEVERREVRKGGGKIEKKEKGRRKRKEKGKEEEEQRNSWRSWTRSGSDRQGGRHGPRSKSSPGPNLRKEWLRCKQRCKQSHSQSQGQAKQKPPQSPSQSQEWTWTCASPSPLQWRNQVRA